MQARSTSGSGSGRPTLVAKFGGLVDDSASLYSVSEGPDESENFIKQTRIVGVHAKTLCKAPPAIFHECTS